MKVTSSRPISYGLAIVLTPLLLAGASSFAFKPMPTLVTGENPEFATRDLSLTRLQCLGCLVSNTEATILSPLSWDRGAWLKFCLATALTIAIASEEGDVHQWLSANQTEDTERVPSALSLFGDGKYAVFGLLLAYTYGYLAEDERCKKTAALSLETIAISGAISFTLKHTTHKHRPSPGQTEEPSWDGPNLSRLHLSFPSGHSAAAFALATVISHQYSDKPAVGPIANTIASLCAASRVVSNSHWISDAFLGRLIGYYTARFVITLHEKPTSRKIVLTPVVGSRFVGLTLSRRL